MHIKLSRISLLHICIDYEKEVPNIESCGTPKSFSLILYPTSFTFVICLRFVGYELTHFNSLFLMS